MLDLFYVKYDTQAAGWFDRVTAAYSFNSQREERVNQGGNGNPRGSITHEYERTSVHGLEAHANKQFESNALLVGGEVYREGIYSPSFSFNPVTASSSLRRGRVPDGARFTSAGIYAQDVYDALPGRLRLVGNLRYSGAWYRVDPDPMGFWPGDSISVGSVSFRAGVVFTPVEEVKFVGNVSRGFRAPHVTDLGTLGLTGSGFEVDSTAVAGRNATIGTTADRNAISSGLPVNQVGPETSLTYEAAVRFRNKRFDTEFGFFVNDIDDSIEKQSLILPAGAVGTQIGGRMITAQTVGGAVFVDASSSPILVRANFTDVRIFGIEHEIEVTLAKSWWLGGNFTYLRARNKSNGLPPNIEGGTPAPEGYIRLRYARPGNRWWFEPFIHLADEQRRLSTLDLEDRRTGATRSRTSIRNFFINGATARGFVGPGPDGRLGTADDLLRSTGETVAQVQNRVLGVGVESAPLFTALPGYAVLSFRGGVKLGEKDDLLFEVENIGDRNYRGISWGQDAPGRGAYLRYRRTL
jgi:hemoglobin/transferrin/lactoferrin receptor protein